MRRKPVYKYVNDKKMEANVDSTLEWLRSLNENEFYAEIKSTISIHKNLFGGINGNDNDVSGVIRDKDIGILFLTEGNVLKRKTLYPPSSIPVLMKRYAGYIDRLRDQKEGDVNEAFSNLCAITILFFRAHPFFDGNGRVYRTVIISLCERLGFQMSRKWKVYPRPYDKHFSYSIRHFRRNPHILYGILRGYITVAGSISRADTEVDDESKTRFETVSETIDNYEE